MPDLVVIIHDEWVTIDGELPEGWRLVVHNHTDNPDLYPYETILEACPADTEAVDVDELMRGQDEADASGVMEGGSRFARAMHDRDDPDSEEACRCYLYIDAPATR